VKAAMEKLRDESWVRVFKVMRKNQQLWFDTTES